VRKPIAELVDVLSKANEKGQLTPLLSREDPDLDLKSAYEVQTLYVRRRLAHDRVAGLKAGLTSEAGQKRMGVTAPVAAVLFASGRKEGSPVIDRSAFKRLVVETEIGFVLGERIGRALPDVASVRERVRAVGPAIELPDLGFADPPALKGIDIIAANGGAAQFIAGRESLPAAMDGGELGVTLSHDGRVVNQWTGAAQREWSTALWLINTMLEHGWTLEPGHILITGALGKDVPGEPGQYEADFGRLGTISFEIR
jgi:2-keto-4-pentenoate hydratase